MPLELLPLIPEGKTGAARVSINSFGYGGTNCHMILESLEQFLSDNTHFTSDGVNGTNGTNGVTGIEVDAASASGMPLLFPLSASSEAALEAMPAQIQKWLAGRDTSASDLRDLSYTLACRRSLFRWRKAFVAADSAQLAAALDVPKISKTRAAPSAKIGFVFTGQGAQWAGMGVELMASSHIFKNSIDESSRILENLGCEWNLEQELGKAADVSRINESELAQPTTTIIQMALVDMLSYYGVKPQFVAGHSSGEIAAAYAAGALAREGAIIA